jgi:uncharacterized membrane protein YebE (DUF533 family)
MTPFARELFITALRNGLKFGGFAGLLSDSQIVEMAGAMSVIAGLAWSAYNDWKKTRPAVAPVRLVSPRNRPVGKRVN